VVDPAAPGNAFIVPGGPKLVRVDLATDRVAEAIAFDETVASQGSYLNDVRFSPDGSHAYLTDSGTTGALVVVDLRTLIDDRNRMYISALQENAVKVRDLGGGGPRSPRSWSRTSA
jgi:hypothetical protein